MRRVWLHAAWPERERERDTRGLLCVSVRGPACKAVNIPIWLSPDSAQQLLRLVCGSVFMRGGNCTLLHPLRISRKTLSFSFFLVVVSLDFEIFIVTFTESRLYTPDALPIGRVALPLVVNDWKTYVNMAVRVKTCHIRWTNDHYTTIKGLGRQVAQNEKQYMGPVPEHGSVLERHRPSRFGGIWRHFAMWRVVAVDRKICSQKKYISATAHRTIQNFDFSCGWLAADQWDRKYEVHHVGFSRSLRDFGRCAGFMNWDFFIFERCAWAQHAVE